MRCRLKTFYLGIKLRVFSWGWEIWGGGGHSYRDYMNQKF